MRTCKVVRAFLCCMLLELTEAFVPASLPERPLTELQAVTLSTGRRSLLQTSITAGALFLLEAPALASGGATAGGAYLLSAKQRYNKRVTASMKNFAALKKQLESGSLDGVASFFSTEEAGGWKDGSAAAFLLANAFRINSTAGPDSLPSVKKWKAFASQVEVVMKAAKKKDATKTLDAYNKAMLALDEFLTQVELPPASEM